jgi:hypothetical protein
MAHGSRRRRMSHASIEFRDEKIAALAALKLS